MKKKIVKFLEKNTRTLRRPFEKPWRATKNFYKKIKKKIRKALKLDSHTINHSIIRTKEELDAFALKNSKISDLAKSLNKELKEAGEFGSTQKGICVFCNKVVDLKYDFIIDWIDYVAFRERLLCPICNGANRIRAMLYMIQKLVDYRENLKIYSYEQITSFYHILEKSYAYESTVIGSEFISYDTPGGTVINGIRHEDATNLSFEDESLDFIVSNDVYEHVPDIVKTFQEAYRTLKKDGYVLFTIPFFPDFEKSVVRAKVENGELVLLMEKEIHGNPMSDDGSLAFYNFGWDILEMLKQVGFNDPHIVAILDEKYGHIDYDPILVFVAQK